MTVRQIGLTFAVCIAANLLARMIFNLTSGTAGLLATGDVAQGLIVSVILTAVFALVGRRRR